MDVTGKGALVTGGASGIGAAAVRRLAAAGARVAVADRDKDAARALAGEVGDIALSGDVADPERMPAHVAGRRRGASADAGSVGADGVREPATRTVQPTRGRTPCPPAHP